ncbi:MAG TPA: septal ring lytic transglycosylase RlpA family protein [Stellaceae bacterium]|nr:septal ring lytic transglycosylase RlpA family protein [Stellaceae bacterium]
MIYRTMAVLIAMGALAQPACAKARIEKGWASWYGHEEEGRRTASGERMDCKRLTAAHRTLPFGSVVEVVNRRNGRSVLVTINDRGPHRPNRIIDLSPVAAAQLGMQRKGLAPVTIKPPPFE